MAVAMVDEAFDHRSWHGTTLRGALRRVDAAAAAWRPAAGRHDIWEGGVHCAYWKYVVRRRLTGEPRGGFPMAGSDWFPSPRPLTEAAWREAVALLGAQHRQLRSAILSTDAADLESDAGGGTTRAALVRGIAAHDLYHAGQIQLIKRLASRRA